MAPRFLLDTHIVFRWLAEPKKLSRNQSRALDDAVRSSSPLVLSDVTLIELAVLFAGGGHRLKRGIDDLFGDLRSSSTFRILPVTLEIAAEIFHLGGVLRDPADRTIVATARVHRLTLLTSDQRIIESGLTPVID